jgi:hypothetical protein
MLLACLFHLVSDGSNRQILAKLTWEQNRWILGVCPVVRGKKFGVCDA